MTDDPRDAETPKPRLRHEVADVLRRAEEEAEIHRIPTDRAPPFDEPEPSPRRHNTDEPVSVVDALRALVEKMGQDLQDTFADMLTRHEQAEQAGFDRKLEAHHLRLAKTTREEVEKLTRPFLERYDEWRKGEALRIAKLEERVTAVEAALDERVADLKDELAAVKAELADARKQ